jgi:hypothetical protein
MRLRGEVGRLREENSRMQISASKPTTTQQQPEENTSPEERQKRMAILKMQDARLLALAEIMYAQTNQGQLATNFDQIAAYLTNSDSSLSGSNSFELVYRGTMDELTNAGSAILMRESQSWPTTDGQWAKSYVFGDGHAEVHLEPNDNFDTFEQQHTPLQPPAQ